MNTNVDWLQRSLAIGPELLLMLGGLVVLLVDMWLADDDHPLLPGLTGLFMVGALIWSFVPFIPGMGITPGTIYGMFALDNLTIFFRVFVLTSSLLVLALTTVYIKGRTEQTGEFYSLLLFITLSVILASAANNLIMIYLAFEFLSLTSYIMVGWLRDDVRSNEAAMKYLLYGAISSAVMLYGMSLLYGATGSTNIAEIAAVFANPRTEIVGIFNLGITAAVLMMVGFGFKVALVPFHQWSPDAYEGAPTPVTTFLSVGPKAAGFAIMIRVLTGALGAQTESWQAMLSAVAILTMVVGNLTALAQTDMKRLLAYSSIAQAGYILMGLVANNPADNFGIRAVLVYLLAYLFTNIGLFVSVIGFEQATGSTTIDDYRGLIRRSPFHAMAMVIFFLSLLGIPPTAGFLGKFLVFGAVINAELYFLAVVGMLTSVISAYYYLNVVRVMFFQGDEEDRPLRFAFPLQAVLVITLVGTLLMNLYPTPFLNLIGEPTNLVTQLFGQLPF
ncbi:MAG: NADH-quinone oxidoreductase subunit N [Ardenticatenales bacterium]|nr:NADH-quinone oxidoreductase subunit N [Ardenticatenales bacterium]